MSLLFILVRPRLGAKIGRRIVSAHYNLHQVDSYGWIMIITNGHFYTL